MLPKYLPGWLYECPCEWHFYQQCHSVPCSYATADLGYSMKNAIFEDHKSKGNAQHVEAMSACETAKNRVLCSRPLPASMLYLLGHLQGPDSVQVFPHKLPTFL